MADHGNGKAVGDSNIQNMQNSACFSWNLSSAAAMNMNVCNGDDCADKSGGSSSSSWNAASNINMGMYSVTAAASPCVPQTARPPFFRSVRDNSVAVAVAPLSMDEAKKCTRGTESDEAEAEASTAHEESSSSDHLSKTNARKRKQIKSVEADESKSAKHSSSGGMIERDGAKAKAESRSDKQPSEAKEDYIHVRARRGQATNSHSLAERVRREKISERMKFLQDLVPGCNKVTGKAVMLDEIINYVQSLQRQVEFLSMKLAAVNPRLDFNVERILSKDLHLTQGSSSAMMFTSDNNASYPQLHQSQHGIVHVGPDGHGIVSHSEALRRTINPHLACIDGFENNRAQVQSVWDDELQSVVQMGFGPNNHNPLTSQQGDNDSVATVHIKNDL